MTPSNEVNGIGRPATGIDSASEAVGAGGRMPASPTIVSITLMIYETVAAVDLGSNSFRLQVGRVVDDQIYTLDSLKESVRLASGLMPDKRLDAAAQARALDALRRFGERLGGLD